MHAILKNSSKAGNSTAQISWLSNNITLYYIHTQQLIHYELTLTFYKE